MKTIQVVLLLGSAAFSGSSSAQGCPDCWWNSPVPSEERRSERGWMDGMPSMRRHHYVMNRGLPAEYRALDNPLRADDSVLATGQRIYEQTCAACHGEQGRGDGLAGDALQPRPANLQHLSRMSMMASDTYLYWTIAEGGQPIDTDMPAFKEALSPVEIWSVVLFLRRGL